MLKRLKQINWKQPKYILPAVLYPLLLVTGYCFIDLFHAEKAELPNGLETTDYLNPSLPEAQLRDDGIGGRHDNMERAFGKIHDYSAVETIDQQEEPVNEEYNSRYTAEDLAMLEADAAARQAEMEEIERTQRRLEESARKAGAIFGDGDDVMGLSEEDRLMATSQRQSEELGELEALLAKTRPQTLDPDSIAAKAGEFVTEVEAAVETAADAVTELADNVTSEAVVKKVNAPSAYFNTISDNEPQSSLIKAIIDEDIKCMDGSRVRLRLLDDVAVEGATLPKGTYLYATMSGFGQQRVKGSIQSVLVNDRLVKISLSIYDTDGLEGLYVPQSQFRETAKDVASGAMSSSVTVNSGGYDNNLAQWGMQSLQNAVSKTTSAISHAIRKNKAKLKYGTQVYLVNGKDIKK